MNLLRLTSYSTPRHFSSDALPDDDEGSLSSTFTVEKQVLKQPQHVKSSSSSSKRRCIRFNEEANVAYDNNHFYHEDCAANWYQPEEYTLFKKIYTTEAKQILVQERMAGGSPFQLMMEQVFHTLLNNSSQVNEKVAFQKARATNINLVHEGKMAPLMVRCGAERTTVRRLRNDKRERRHQICLAVLETQEAYYYDDDNRREQLIAQAAQDVSRPSCQFAHFLAKLQYECYDE
mmetsp:Transcript_10400/g.28737  ORF Transcript_10400/g.28737 Transcript_10400/m.28737 type:complete len:233 (-) Transcript_10400:103-801(-)